jgi:cellulose 1,4-beta-cellobiosidase
MDDGTWDEQDCPNNEVCAQRCALDGVPENDWSQIYGIKAEGSSVKLNFKTGSNVGSRMYLMNESEDGFKAFKLVNKEFTFDVDVSNLPCGINGALYFSQMDESGAKKRDNKAGAEYGTGYCDA